MTRLITNKHFPNASDITADKFSIGSDVSLGEIVISNEVGNEGIWILNADGTPTKIGANAEMASAIEMLMAEVAALKKIQRSSDHVAMTLEQYEEMVENGTVIIDGETVEFNEDTYYCIYEEAPQTEANEPIVNGDTMIIEFSDATVVEDGGTLILDLGGIASVTEGGILVFEGASSSSASVNIASDIAEVDTNVENGILSMPFDVQDGYIII